MSISFDSEHALELYIVDHMKKHKKCPITGYPVDYVFSQVDIGDYGVADIVTVRKVPVCDLGGGYTAVKVIELKNTPLKPNDVAQLARYVTGIENAFGDEATISVMGYLAGKFDGDRDLCYLMNELQSISVYGFELDINGGISWTQHSLGRWRRSGCDHKELKNKLKKQFLRGARN